MCCRERTSSISFGAVLWKSGDSPASIVGKWIGRVNGEAVGMEFLDDGRLAYVVLTADGKRQTMRLSYRVEGNVLVTTQPSNPREERSEFQIEGNSLSISFGGQRSVFQRQY